MFQKPRASGRSFDALQGGEKVMRGLLIGLALALVAAPAWAQTPQQRDWCSSDTATDDQTIDGCTALIASGRETTVGQAAAYYNRGIGYEDKGLHDQAIADYTQAIALKPDYAVAYDNRGNAFDSKGLYDQAIADHSQAIALQPGLANAHYNRGHAYAANGRYDQAIADYTQAIALKPDYVKAIENRGLAYEKKGSRDQAIADFRASLRLDPNRTLAREGLTRLGATP